MGTERLDMRKTRELGSHVCAFEFFGVDPPLMARLTSARSATNAGSVWVRWCQHRQIETLVPGASAFTARS